MKLLFNLDVIEGNRVTARPSDYLRSLPRERQLEVVTEFLLWAENEARTSQDPKVRTEAEIGVVTAREFLDKLAQAESVIYTGGNDRSQS